MYSNYIIYYYSAIIGQPNYPSAQKVMIPNTRLKNILEENLFGGIFYF